MKTIKNVKSVTLIIIITINILLYVQFIKIDNSLVNYQSEIEDLSIIKIDADVSQINGANSSPSNETISGLIDQRDGKIFSDVSLSCSSCFINRYDPNLNEQPSIYIPGWNLTHALMYFENIKAINYTRDIETDTNEFIQAVENYSTYIYQKFSVDINQYLNNVSLFIQDINNPLIYTDNNSWEVAIMSCENDTNGTPNKTLGEPLKNQHPLNFAAHWEVFEFKTSKQGPIFLNTSQTNFTTDEEGNKKFWFAIRVIMPPDDGVTGGGPKFLYMNPDGGDFSNIGEGDTFKKYTEIFYNISTINNVSYFYNPPNSGTILYGTLESFRYMDEDRCLAEKSTDNLTIILNFTISNLTTGITYDWLKKHPFQWWSNHCFHIYHIDFNIITNISENVEIANIYIKNHSYIGSDEQWVNFSDKIDIKQEEESLLYLRIDDFQGKDTILKLMDTTNDVNNLTFALQYNGTENFNISINKFTVDIVELKTENDTILPHDPQIMELYYPKEPNVINGTEPSPWVNQDPELLKLNDDNYFYAQADANNLSIEFEFNILSQFNSSLWEVNIYDYLFLYPNPAIPQMDLRISSNVSVNPDDLSLAILEIFKGTRTLDFLSEEENSLYWLPVSDNKSFAFENETQVVRKLTWPYNWLALQFINSSANNLLQFRLRYNSSQTEYNVSIDEFSLLVYIQNAISSDITCKLGLGLDSDVLKPTDIKMKNNGIDVNNNGNGKGIWECALFAVPSQGYYYFNVTSLWNSITFDVVGIYQIEKYYGFQWEYYLTSGSDKILWYITSDIANYHGSTKLGTKGLKVTVSKNWSLMQIYNDTTSDGYWTWNTQTIGLLKSIEVYNISDGTWKVQMNSSVTPMTVVYNTSNSIKIDKYIQADISIPTDYGGDLKFEIFDAQPKSIWEDNFYLNLSSLENSHVFIWDIFDTTQSDGTYYLKSSWIKYNQTHAFLSLETKQIIVSKYNSKLELLNIEKNFENNSIFGSEIKIEGKLLNNETSAPIVEETIYVEIYSENEIIDVKSDTTDAEGIIQLVYDLPEETEGYNSITIKLVYNQTDSYYDTVESEELITINLISQGQAFFNTFLMYLPYIAIIGAVMAGTLTVRHQRLSKARKKWAKDALILDDLLKISYIMIILKESGISIYNKMLSAKEIEPDLISGFLHAVAQFKREIKRDLLETEVSKGFEMDYGDFKIVITDSKLVRVAFILEETPSYQLKEKQAALTNAFEQKFKPYLEKFTGDLTPFGKADELIEKYFSPSLTYPLILGKYRFVYSGKLKPLESALMEVAEQIQKDKNFFFVSSLLNYGLAGRKESRDHIISSIISLKQKGILEPYEFNQ